MTQPEKIVQYYWKGSQNKSTAIHWEILKHARGKSLDFLGQEKGDRFQQYGDISDLKKALKAKFGPSTENPGWDVFNSVEYVRHVVEKDRSTFQEDLKEGMSHEELAREYRTYHEAVEKKHELLKQNKLDSTVYFPANLKQHWKHFLYDQVPYDLVLDIDGPEVIAERTVGKDKKEIEEDIENGEIYREEVIEYSRKEAERVKEFLDEKNVAYSLKFSGGKGFHFEIPRHFKDDPSRTGIVSYVDDDKFSRNGKAFAQYIQEKTGAIVDMGIYSSKRIFRTPYTVHTGSGLLCYPLTDKEFENFQLEKMDPLAIKRSTKIRDRGLQVRKGDAGNLIRDFQKWKQDNDLEKTETEENTGSRRLDKVERLAREYRNLSKAEKELFDEKTGGSADD